MNSSENINKNEMNKKSSTMRLIAYMKPYAHWVIFCPSAGAGTDSL